MVLTPQETLILPLCCRTTNVLSLAEYIKETGDLSVLGKLSDTIMDAGYEGVIIDHLLDPTICHHQTCPVLVGILGQGIVPKNTNTYLVDFDQNLQESIVANNYDWVNYDITTDHFPPSEDEVGKREQNFKIYHFKKEVESDFVIAEMEKDQRRPATLRELLAYGKANPELQRKFSIIALGSVYLSRGNRLVPSLDGYDVGGVLALGYGNARWYGHCRFLSVRK